MRKTKIIATIGPATTSKEKIHDLISSGVDVFRINMSHEVKSSLLGKSVDWIRSSSAKIGKSVAIIMDLCGPKIRVGDLTSASLEITSGGNYTLSHIKGDIPLNLPLEFDQCLEDGGQVKIDDGSLTFDITKIEGETLYLRAKDSGRIIKGKGVNFPGVNFDVSPLTEKDFQDIKLAVELEIDWLAMSFVRSPEDIDKINSFLKELGSSIPVIAKIEKPEAIENLSGIIQKFDGVLVARGDLGVEMPLQELPRLQKSIVNECLVRRKPVIIATQMLETMINNANPTRAEVNDIANAIYDGADAVMLSAETAIGEYPIESVEMMAGVADNIESDLDLHNFNRYINDPTLRLKDKRNSICHAAMTLANDLSIETIVIMTESGKTAIQMSQYRPKSKIFALSHRKRTYQMLSLIRGIIPIHVDMFNSTDEMIDACGEILMQYGYLNKGDSFIITAGEKVGVSGTTNMLKIHRV